MSQHIWDVLDLVDLGLKLQIKDGLKSKHNIPIGSDLVHLSVLVHLCGKFSLSFEKLNPSFQFPLLASSRVVSARVMWAALEKI